jgi:serine/threonine protein kinase
VLFLWKFFQAFWCLGIFAIFALVSSSWVPGLDPAQKKSGRYIIACILALRGFYPIFCMVQACFIWKVHQKTRRQFFGGFNGRHGDKSAQAIVGEDALVEFEDFSFSRKNLIGKGAAGRVYFGTFEGMHVAVKEHVITSQSSPETEQEFIREVQLLKQLRHDRVVRFYGCSVVGTHYYIISELCDCSLADVLNEWNNEMEGDADAAEGFEHQKGGEPCVSSRSSSRTVIPSFFAEESTRFAHQLAVGMKFLSGRGIIHCDLKPENCLLRSVRRPAGGGQAAFGASSSKQEAEEAASPSQPVRPSSKHYRENSSRERAQGEGDGGNGGNGADGGGGGSGGSGEGDGSGSNATTGEAKMGDAEGRTRHSMSVVDAVVRDRWSHYDLKICDFGISHQDTAMSTGATMQSTWSAGTPSYMAPELFSEGFASALNPSRKTKTSAAAAAVAGGSAGSRRVGGQGGGGGDGGDGGEGGDGSTVRSGGAASASLYETTKIPTDDVSPTDTRAKRDVFAFAVLLWEIVNRSRAWNELNWPHQITTAILRGDRPPTKAPLPDDTAGGGARGGGAGVRGRGVDEPPTPEPGCIAAGWWREHLSTLMQDCWQDEPSLRPSFAEIEPALRRERHRLRLLLKRTEGCGGGGGGGGGVGGGGGGSREIGAAMPSRYSLRTGGGRGGRGGEKG